MSLRFSKQPTEAYFIQVEFINALPIGANIASVTVVARNTNDGTIITPLVIDEDTLVINGTKVGVRVKDGVHGLRAKITFVVTLDDHETKPTILEEDVIMLVREI